MSTNDNNRIIGALEDLAAGRIDRTYQVMATCHPKLTRGQVWCKTCGATQQVNTEAAFRKGWPKCCGYTMTIDAPDEHP